MGNALSNIKKSSKSKSPSSTSTISSSSSNLSNSEWYRYEQGRRFHNFESEEARYILPNDLSEQDRLQLQHYLLRFAWKGNYSSPVREILQQFPTTPANVFRVLDVGCGPGTWTLEMASDYPNAHFYGVDMSAIFPAEIHPKNCEFRQLNVLNGLPWPNEYFSFVYQRFMLFSYTEEQWDYVIKELLRVTKKGGWLEIFETSTDMGSKPSTAKKIDNAIHQLSRSRGINTHILPQLPEMLCAQNQVEEVFVERVDIPLGSWGGRVGELCCDNMAQAFENIKVPMAKHLEITNEEYDKMRAKAVAEFNSVVKIPMLTGRIYGRKKAVEFKSI